MPRTRTTNRNFRRKAPSSRSVQSGGRKSRSQRPSRSQSRGQRQSRSQSRGQRQSRSQRRSGRQRQSRSQRQSRRQTQRRITKKLVQKGGAYQRIEAKRSPQILDSRLVSVALDLLVSEQKNQPGSFPIYFFVYMDKDGQKKIAVRYTDTEISHYELSYVDRDRELNYVFEFSDEDDGTNKYKLKTLDFVDYYVVDSSLTFVNLTKHLKTPTTYEKRENAADKLHGGDVKRGTFIFTAKKGFTGLKDKIIFIKLNEKVGGESVEYFEVHNSKSEKNFEFTLDNSNLLFLAKDTTKIGPHTFDFPHELHGKEISTDGLTLKIHKSHLFED